MKIEFFPSSIEVQNSISMPISSQKFVPNWYKSIAPSPNKNLKSCIPFLDALTHGFIQKTWTDILIENTKNGLKVSTSHQVPIVKVREKNDLPSMLGYLDIQFVWQRQWSPIFPKGFSGLVTHPLNRIDLPFYTFAGIVDFDSFLHAKVGNLPFYLKKDFEGIIPAGTPMFQIIPIARANWESEQKKYDENEWLTLLTQRNNEPAFYKKRIWHKRNFKKGQNAVS